jgi:hypothetical protein
MKTHFSLSRLMIAVLISFILLSCEKENSLSTEGKNQVISELEIQAKNLKSEVISKAEDSDTMQINLPVTKEMEAKVIEVVKPVKEIVEKLLNEDKTGTYQAYKKDLEQLNKYTDPKEQASLVEEIQKKYLEFFQELWKKADIDEKAYQMKIKNIFPDDVKETIQFTEFLNFSMHVKKHTRDNTPPSPTPVPQNICIDPKSLLFGINKSEKSLFSRADVIVTPDLVEGHTVSEVAGFSKATAGIGSNITVPGTFPDDNKQVRVRKSFTWHGHILAISFIGCAFATMEYSTFVNEEFLRLWAPVTWLSFKDIDEVKTEEYVTPKVGLLRFGVIVYSDTYAGAAALSFSTSNCDKIEWSICEE